MNSFRKKSKYFIPLLTATIVIWGVVIFNIVEYMLTEAEPGIEIIEDNNLPLESIIHESREHDDVQPVIGSLQRDPFIIRRKTSQQKPEPPKLRFVQDMLRESPIEFKINGVIISGSSKIAILEDITNGNTQFLKIGDEYKGIKILDISEQVVKLQYFEEKIEHNLK